MAVQRVEWRCPGCGKRYAIPADMPTPELCPKCRSSAEVPEPTAGEPRAEGPASEAAASPRAFLDSAREPAESGSRVTRPVRRHRDLYLISFLLKALSGVTAAAGMLVLIWSAVQAFASEPGPERTASILLGLGTFGSCLLSGVLLWTIGGLIRVLLDIEQNTRRS